MVAAPLIELDGHLQGSGHVMHGGLNLNRAERPAVGLASDGWSWAAKVRRMQQLTNALAALPIPRQGCPGGSLVGGSGALQHQRAVSRLHAWRPNARYASAL